MSRSVGTEKGAINLTLEKDADSQGPHSSSTVSSLWALRQFTLNLSLRFLRENGDGDDDHTTLQGLKSLMYLKEANVVPNVYKYSLHVISYYRRNSREGFIGKANFAKRGRQIPYDISYMWNLKYDSNELI